MSLTEIRGLIPHEQGKQMTALAATVEPPNVIVEIGSFQGLSTCYLAEGARVRVYAVDPWTLDGNPNGRFGFAEQTTLDAFHGNVARYGERVVPVQAFSTDAARAWANGPVGMLYIDGDHSAEAVRADYEAWRPHLADGAIVAFDDYGTPKNPGVKEVVDSLTELTPVIVGERLAVGGYRGS
jgi:predicted O-methyltransferase YrrM